MARLIDADELLEKCFYAYTPGACEEVVGREEIENAPTVDAVEVVRCEKCKYWKDKMYAEPLKGFCEIHEFCTENDEFCSCGAKMDGGDE